MSQSKSTSNDERTFTTLTLTNYYISVANYLHTFLRLDEMTVYGNANGKMTNVLVKRIAMLPAQQMFDNHK